MKVELEIDHTVSRDEIQNWIDEVLKPQNPCVWKAEITDHYCESYCMQGLKQKKLEKENTDLKAQIEKMKCCGNCINWNSKVGYCYKAKNLTNGYTRNCNKWELAE